MSCLPLVVHPSRTPAAGDGAAWNEREARFLDGRLGGPVGPGPRGRAAGSPARLVRPPGRYVRVRPPGSLLPGRRRSLLVVPPRPTPSAARPRRHGRRPVAGNPRHAAGLSRPHCHALSPHLLILDG